MKDIGRRRTELPVFASDEDYLHMLDILAKNYGTLPSEIAKLPWSEIVLNVACLKTRSARIEKVIRKYNRKKASVFPKFNVTDMINVL